MKTLVERIAGQEGILLILCVCSDFLPSTLLSSFLDSHDALWKASVDNLSHAGIAASSWAVVVSLSPPSSGADNFPELALPGSPLHRCFSCARLLATGGRRRNHANNASHRPPPLLPPLPPPRPETMDSRPKDLTSRSRDFDVEIAEQSSPTTTVSGQPALPLAARGIRGAGGGCTARRPSAAAALEVLFAACVGSALDLDHFLAAGSVRLSRATALGGRPWGHCVAALIVAAFAVAALTRNARAAVCVFSAGATHQLRDSTRRGLWLYPPRGPKTPPVSYPIYLLAQALLPLLVAMCLQSGHGSRCGYSCVQRNTRHRRGLPCTRRRCRGDVACVRARRADNKDEDGGTRAAFSL
ncbi:unnamed protein product [Ectocarpus sp. 12 AP-2014]